MSTLLWIVLPYAVIAVFVGGHAWRRHWDEVGWTTRSSQLLESRWLSIGSPLFHFGLLGVIGGHVLGILVPARATRAVGLSDHAYHLSALWLGGAAGVAALAGLVILTARSFLCARVRRASRPSDHAVALLLLVVVGLGMGETLGYNLGVAEYDYRSTIAPWFRHLVTFRPDAALMDGVPLVYRAHLLASMALFALWPFSKLVHVWTIPLQYLRRSQILYRARSADAGRHLAAE